MAFFVGGGVSLLVFSVVFDFWRIWLLHSSSKSSAVSPVKKGDPWLESVELIGLLMSRIFFSVTFTEG